MPVASRQTRAGRPPRVSRRHSLRCPAGAVHAGLLEGLPRNLVRDGERISADIDPCVDLLAHRVLPWYGVLRSPDPEPSPTDLVDAGSQASEPPRLWQRGRGTHLTHKLMASGGYGLPGEPVGAYDKVNLGNWN